MRLGWSATPERHDDPVGTAAVLDDFGGPVMLSERVVDWTKQWKQEGRHSEQRMLLRQIRRRFGERIAEQSTPLLAQIEQLPALHRVIDRRSSPSSGRGSPR